MISLLSVFGTYQVLRSGGGGRTTLTRRGSRPCAQRFFGEQAEFHDTTSSGEKFKITGTYLALVAGLLGAMAINNKYRKSPAQLRKERGLTQPASELERQLVSFAEEHKDPDHDAQRQLEAEDPWLASRRH
jgi:hypothetical protein